METKPILALTTGDPAGVGPEISIKAALLPAIRHRCRLVLLADLCVLGEVSRRLKLHGKLRAVTPEELGSTPAPEDTHTIEVLDCRALEAPPEPSLASPEGGRASFRYIERSIQLALEGVFDGVVTAPINKKSLQLAGISFHGHTEVFADYTGTESFAMMMYSERIAVALVTCHQSLRSVPDSLRKERIVEVGRLLADNVARIRGSRPRIAALGLNPHAGEEGLFGDEELWIVTPAVTELRALGYDVEGPVPPDTAFTPDKMAHYGAFLCLYHDQGLIPFKMVAFDEGVNVTLGLPFPRTSVDHGTAYDIAWKGVASTSSLQEAIHLAAKLSTDQA